MTFGRREGKSGALLRRPPFLCGRGGESRTVGLLTKSKVFLTYFLKRTFALATDTLLKAEQSGASDFAVEFTQSSDTMRFKPDTA